MTDAQLTAILDADYEEREALFMEAVDVVRSGMVFAYDLKAFQRWKAEAERRANRRPSGPGLGQLARDLGQAIGGQVVAGEFEFRN